MKMELTSCLKREQGDPLAMAMYAVAIRRLLDKLKDKVPGVKQVWYADDCTGAGRLRELHS